MPIPNNSKNNTHFYQCIKCTVCTVHCPVSKANPNYPGPKQCGPDGERLRLKAPDFYDDALSMCTNCKRCETACPSGVDIADIILLARNKHEIKGMSPKRVRDFILGNTDLMGKISIRFSSVINKLTKMNAIKQVMHHTIGINKHKTLPEYTAQSFRQWFKQHEIRQAGFKEQVCYFHGCYVNYNNPELGKAVVSIFNAMNIGVKLTREKCCGIALMANGFHEKAKKDAQHNIAQFSHLPEKTPIVSTSSTCTMTIKSEYQSVLSLNTEAYNNETYYITRYILKRLMEGKHLPLRNLPLKVLYHTPCHMERTGQVIFTLELIKMIPGIEIDVLDSQCCGIAGTYGFKNENYETSMKIGESLFNKINKKEADYIVTDCETCKWQLDENTQLMTIHPLLLLDMALNYTQ